MDLLTMVLSAVSMVARADFWPCAVGAPGMNIPPLDPNGAKGEHFHSLVDNTTNPKIFVINDNTRAYPGMVPSVLCFDQERTRC
jgi:hypothetical protein